MIGSLRRAVLSEIEITDLTSIRQQHLLYVTDPIKGEVLTCPNDNVIRLISSTSF